MFSMQGKMGDLKRRLMFLLGALIVYRIGAHIPVPGIDPVALADLFKSQKGGILGGPVQKIDKSKPLYLQGDDLIYDPAAFPEAKSLAVLAENCFVGLQSAGNRMLVVTWPKGRQQVQLGLGNVEDKRSITSLDLQADGQSFFLASLAAPGIWHREELKAGFLEKDVTLAWQRPFPAKWKTQLSESGTRTTYAFRQTKGTIWRGVPGSYDFPAWFEGETAMMRLGKKVPPKGEALIYFLEARETPASVVTPVDILKATLGRPMCEAIMDPAGRQLQGHGIQRRDAAEAAG